MYRNTLPDHNRDVTSLDHSGARAQAVPVPPQSELPHGGSPAPVPSHPMSSSNAAFADPAPPTNGDGPDLSELRATLRLIHSPLDSEPAAWRSEVSRSLKTLLGADAAVCLFWREGALETSSDGLEPGIIDEYFEHFRAVDHGMRRRDALGLGLWSRRLLWDREELLQSAYFNEFARPRSLYDSLGLSVDLDDIPSHMRVVLLYRRGPLWPEGSEHRLRRLEPVLPALRSGLRIQLGFERWLGLTASLLDKIGERLSLFSLEGRELYRSARMRRTLDNDPCRDRVLEGIRAAAQAVASVARNGCIISPQDLRRLEASRQDVQGATGRYRARACLVGPDVVAPETVVLVTLDPLAAEIPPPQTLHARYGLTPREVEVTRLLVQRMTNREIANALGISAHTARHHTESVLLKTHVNTRRALRNLLSRER